MSLVERFDAFERRMPRRLAVLAGRLLTMLALVCLPTASVQAQSATPTPTPPSTSTSGNEHWMADLSSYIGKTSLKHIVIPGSHDAASYALTGPAWTYGGTQNVDIKTQLNHGVRYLDLRGNYHDGDIFVSHGLESSSFPLKSVLSDVGDWANVTGHEREVLLVSVSIGCKNADTAPPDDLLGAVCRTFVTAAGPALLTRSTLDSARLFGPVEDLSPDQLAGLSDQPRIITTWGGCNDAQGSSIGLTGLPGYYANVCDQTSVINWIGQALSSRAQAGDAGSSGDTHSTLGSEISGFYTLSVAQTTTANCGVPLYWMGDNNPALRAVKGWYMSNTNNARTNLNILYADFVQTNQVVESAILMNQVPPVAPTTSYAATKVYLKVANGRYLTAVNGGNVGGSNASGALDAIVHTDASSPGPWETFWVQWLDEGHTKLALKTATGNYMTAVNGGGMGKPNGWSTDVPLHTDASGAGTWEALTLNIDRDYTVGNLQPGTLQTSDGHYVSAVNGGGYGENGNNTVPIHMDATSLGQYEQFTVVYR